MKSDFDSLTPGIIPPWKKSNWGVIPICVFTFFSSFTVLLILGALISIFPPLISVFNPCFILIFGVSIFILSLCSSILILISGLFISTFWPSNFISSILISFFWGIWILGAIDWEFIPPSIFILPFFMDISGLIFKLLSLTIFGIFSFKFISPPFILNSFSFSFTENWRSCLAEFWFSLPIKLKLLYVLGFPLYLNFISKSSRLFSEFFSSSYKLFLFWFIFVLYSSNGSGILISIWLSTLIGLISGASKGGSILIFLTSSFSKSIGL